MRSHPRMLAAATLVLGGLSGVLLHDSRSSGAVPVPAEPVPVPAGVTPATAATPAEPRDLDSPAARVDLALGALGREVKKQSHPDALRRAFQAYYDYRRAHPERVRKPYLYFVDYGLDNRTPRGYVFDMQALRVVEGPFTVAHGRGSGAGGVPTRFSNRNGSNATSLGLYLAQETYTFRGKSGGRSYSSVGLRLRGLSGIFNGAARARGVVVHGAPYVTPQRAGRSEGCPAMEESRARRLLPMISNGGMVFHFSPLDRAWLRGETWGRSLAPRG